MIARWSAGAAGHRRVVARGAALMVMGAIALRPIHAQRFEGEVQIRLSGANPGEAPRSMSYATRRGAVRLTISGVPGGAVALIPTGESRIYMLLPAQQSYVEMPTPSTTSTTPEPVTVKKTGRTVVIAGEPCEMVIVTVSGGTVDVCLTTALGPWLNPMRAAAGATISSWEKALGPDGFPLKVTLPDGTVSMEVLRIERKRLAPALFEVPSNYVKMAVPVRR